MASATVKRDISTIFLLVLSITGAIFGLPLAEVDGENRDGQIAQPNGQQMFPADMPPPPPGAFNDPGPGVLPASKLPEPPADDVEPLSNNGLAVNPPAEAAGVAGTGLAMMAGPVVPGADTGVMFPVNMPPPPEGALNDMVPAEGQVVPANNGDMFPVNMPPPPEGAVNDVVLDIEKKLVPVNNGGMFPVNMPPPPQGAVNDMVPAQEQVVPAKNGGMFPDNMPPPPPGAFNDGAAPPIELEIAPKENEVNQENIVPPNKDIASPPYRGMFPPNMPPPPPGAFNEPPPIPKQKAYPAMPIDGTAVEPTYVNGMNVPDAAVVPPSDQNPFMDPNQKSSLPSNQQFVGTENGPSNAPQYQPDTAVSNDPNTPYSQTDVNPQAISPNTQDNPGEGQAQYNPEDPDNLDVSNNPSPIINDQPVESVQNQNEGQIPYNPDELEASQNSSVPISPNDQPAESFPNQNEDVAPVNPSVPEADNGDENPSELPSESTTSEQSYGEVGKSSSYEGEQNKVQGDSQQWSPEESDSVSEEVEESAWEESQSESDYSFMNWVESSDYDSTDSYNEGDGALENSLDDSESEQYESSYLEDGSDYSDSSELDWIFNGGSSMSAGSETSEQEEEEEEDYFGRDLAQETGSNGGDQRQTFPNEFMGEDDMYRTGGTKLIMYCIPALILCVLILLAWKNYRGKIRVVSVHSVDNKQYDWKSDRKSEEHAPMLLDQDQEDRGY
eukprot:XP_780380.2 PREDICTED: formin-like protein 5 isoform X1 [Strongylocentrotus purpuratus]